MKNRRLLSLTLFLSAIAPSILLSQNLKFRSVRIWDSEKANFSGFVDVDVNQGKIVSIKNAKETKNPEYLLPGFCDASVTLGTNSLGGKTTRTEFPKLLSGFLSAGFSHIESVADPNLSALSTEISKSKWNAPILSQSQKPHLYPELPLGEGAIYQSGLKGNVDPKRNRHVPIFLKENENKGFSQTELFSKRKELETNGQLAVAYTFADQTSWEDALDTGFSVLFHPMPEGTNLFRAQKRDFLWAPLFGIVYLQELRGKPDEWKEEQKIWSELNPHFGKTWKESLVLDGENLATESNLPFSVYASQFRLEKETHSHLLFASGAGHFGLFPGQAAVVEVRLWESLLQETEKKSERLKDRAVPFWESLFGQKSLTLLPIQNDEESLPRVRRQIIQTLTETTCQYVGADHGGKLRVGGPAHFSVLAENPLKRTSGIFPIESMVLGGKLVYTSKPTKEGTAK
ncbi:hypothetical protein [Leptospira biflexa]|uniref:hypothetical protein n=1 Tax=Leptospira biflexa TaxID=172 RepID=UPI0010831CE0|nr:hypothetical protein [Leptospira biflexa]TGM38231.1 hypothetical protein EHQ80_11800 [Leptospira biflexa]TGM41562.1 hypothetical protein EHQ89_06365 [Leptospira biflexa]TGM55033.1 hypothetical protein EHQ91_08775 [Leptospira biflexa]